MRTIAIREAEKILPSLVQEAIGGEEVLITINQTVVAKLVGVGSASAPRPQFGSARGLIEIGPDFDAPLDGFKEYIP